MSSLAMQDVVLNAKRTVHTVHGITSFDREMLIRVFYFLETVFAVWFLSFPLLLADPLLLAEESSSQQNHTKKPLIAVMVSDDHYDADKRLPPLMEKLAQENGWDIAVVHGHGTAHFQNIDVLEKADVLVIFIRRFALPKTQLEKVKTFIASGRGVVGLRTASHAFELKSEPIPNDCENWATFDKEVLGCSYHGHGKNEIGLDVENIPTKRDSPILKDVTPNRWHSASSLYFCDPLKKDVTVYQTASSSEVKDAPLTWTRMHGKTRVAFTALGHQKDFEEKAFQLLLRNLVAWAISPQKSNREVQETSL